MSEPVNKTCLTSVFEMLVDRLGSVEHNLQLMEQNMYHEDVCTETGSILPGFKYLNMSCMIINHVGPCVMHNYGEKRIFAVDIHGVYEGFLSYLENTRSLSVKLPHVAKNEIVSIFGDEETWNRTLRVIGDSLAYKINDGVRCSQLTCGFSMSSYPEQDFEHAVVENLLKMRFPKQVITYDDLNLLVEIQYCGEQRTWLQRLMDIVKDAISLSSIHSVSEVHVYEFSFDESLGELYKASMWEDKTYFRQVLSNLSPETRFNVTLESDNIHSFWQKFDLIG